MKQLTLTWLALGLMAAGPAADGPAAPVASLNAGLVAAEKHSGASFPTRYAALAPVVDKAFDLATILKTTVGLRWSGIPADQQARLLAVFRAYTVCNYVANFNSDSQDHFPILPETRAAGADQIVATQIVPSSGDPIRMDYVMRSGPTGWHIVDVLEEGTISQVAVQRSDFRSLLEGGADKLMASLQKKIDTLSGNTIKP